MISPIQHYSKTAATTRNHPRFRWLLILQSHILKQADKVVVTLHVPTTFLWYINARHYSTAICRPHQHIWLYYCLIKTFRKYKIRADSFARSAHFHVLVVNTSLKWKEHHTKPGEQAHFHSEPSPGNILNSHTIIGRCMPSTAHEISLEVRKVSTHRYTLLLSFHKRSQFFRNSHRRIDNTLHR